MPEICLLGTGGMIPLKDRFLTSLYVEHNGHALLIDCGEGTQVAAAVHGAKISRIEALLLTHEHADHVTGLPGLLLSIGNCSRTRPLDIWLPEKSIANVSSLLAVCGHLPYEVVFHGLPDDEPASFTAEAADPMLTVDTVPLCHKIPCIGYRLSFGRKPVFLPEKAKQLGIPVEYWKTLHSGGSVTLPDGRSFASGDVTGGARPPLRITYTTDSLPLPGLADFARDSDLFICEGMYGDEEKKASMNEKCHMLMQDACRLAAEAGAKRLWLTHYSPAEESPEIYEPQLRELFPGVVISKDGERITL
ncbi:MAG: ribonuclease Z [Ruminococcus sp.]|nr:ribonuclease Z [Ruminococcus sp.]